MEAWGARGQRAGERSSAGPADRARSSTSGSCCAGRCWWPLLPPLRLLLLQLLGGADGACAGGCCLRLLSPLESPLLLLLLSGACGRCAGRC